MKTITEKLLEDFEGENVDKPDVRVGAELVPYVPTNEVTIAIDDFFEKMREAIGVSQADWPKGRSLELALKFAVVPKSLKAKFSQN